MPKRILKLSISILVFIYDQAVRFFLYLAKVLPTGRCVVFYYHGISDRWRNQFSEQIRSLVKWAKPLPALFRGTLEQGKYHFVLTFDDALESFVRNALPVIEEYRLSAAVFVPSGWLGRKPGWAVLNEEEGIAESVLGPEEISALNEKLVTIGSHSINHPFFPKLPIEDARTEISGSKTDLEQLTGRPVEAFSFPYGAFVPQQVELARQAGYQRVYTTQPTVVTGRMNGFVFGRTEVKPTDWAPEIFLKVHGAYRWLPAAFKMKGACRLLIRRLTAD
jgi:peptidoglycan/xylan/chitin deacetylase (PgdA/CDA1 family)